MKHRFLWITDPWSTLDYPNDTTLRLIEESIHLGHLNFWCDVKSIRLDNQKALLTASLITEVEPARSETCFSFAPAETLEVSKFHSIHYRVDPPVDHAYLHPLQILASHAGKTSIVNPPSILFSANEKWEGMLLPKLTPPTLVSSDEEALLAFARKHAKVVLKPLHTAQSQGIELIDLEKEPRSAQDLIRSASFNYQNPIQLQKFLPRIAQGETRLWFVDAKLLAVATKLPLRGDFRVNIDRGSLVEPATLSAKEKVAARKIAAHLRKRRIRLAAVDLIDGLITDFNFTSPGLITQIEKATHQNLARKMITALTKSP